ncbi:hypothetical protein EV201_2683 [Ancylomarina subtilis]|uniref:Uncharacterized protein n=1 Tax=Ancylomarina subtilis TaxID=1639035 RepID=A0A4Q7VDL3_9BACT|nr:hypothetical protein [Ancylomarina subtilis]RZT93513.1 hypothetical protein EV201_2683 [Ancylomarina subtilis]
MKKLQELIGVKILSKKEQKAVKGGYSPLDQIACIHDESCGEGWECAGDTCMPKGEEYH